MVFTQQSVARANCESGRAGLRHGPSRARPAEAVPPISKATSVHERGPVRSRAICSTMSPVARVGTVRLALGHDGRRNQVWQERRTTNHG